MTRGKKMKRAEALELLKRRLSNKNLSKRRAAGLITASVLISSSKNIHLLDVASLMKRFKENRFAANVKRGQIASITDNFNFPLEDFLALLLKGTAGKSSKIGLGEPRF